MSSKANIAVASLKDDVPPPPKEDKKSDVPPKEDKKTDDAVASLKGDVPPPPKEDTKSDVPPSKEDKKPDVPPKEDKDSSPKEDKKTALAVASLKGDVPPPPKEDKKSEGLEKSLKDQDPILGSVFEARNIHIISEPWVKLSKILSTFQTLSTNIKIKEENETYSISELKGLNKIDACALKILDRYKLQVEKYKKEDFTKDLSDFFHQIESNREYHARQLVFLYMNSPEDINKKDLEETTLEGLKQIDLYLHAMNAFITDVYSKIWLVNATMIELGKWEVKEHILKPDYVSQVTSGDVTNLPSHIRMVSRIIKETKGTLAKLYPETVLMNYSYFYPVTLYHTGKDPEK